MGYASTPHSLREARQTPRHPLAVKVLEFLALTARLDHQLTLNRTTVSYLDTSSARYRCAAYHDRSRILSARALGFRECK